MLLLINKLLLLRSVLMGGGNVLAFIEGEKIKRIGVVLPEKGKSNVKDTSCNDDNSDDLSDSTTYISHQDIQDN